MADHTGVDSGTEAAALVLHSWDTVTGVGDGSMEAAPGKVMRAYDESLRCIIRDGQDPKEGRMAESTDI